MTSSVRRRKTSPGPPRKRNHLITTIVHLRLAAKEAGLWLPHMPHEWGGLGLGPTAVAAVSAEAARASLGPFALGCQAPDEGNMHTLLHFGTDEQKRDSCARSAKATADRVSP